MEDKQGITFEELFPDPLLREDLLTELRKPRFNPAHLALLQQGKHAWNTWREQHPEIQPDLTDADLSNADLTDFNLSSTYLHYANLSGATLKDARLDHAALGGLASTEGKVKITNLSNTDLSGALLEWTNLSFVNFSGANLNGASLHYATLNYTNVEGANFSQTQVSDTTFANLDLRHIRGLAAIEHRGPSIVQLHTVQLPQDGSALHFLRGAGIPDEWIDDYRARMMHPIQYHSCFLSYSSQDNTLAHRLHADLQDHGVRCWFAPEDMKIGDKLRTRIDEAIYIHEKLLLLLSENAIKSDWVEDEVEAALEKEQRQQRDVLFPVSIDNAVMETSQAWAAKLRRQRHIGDFTRWMEPQQYQQAFEHLLRDLKKSE